jgi:rod shape-determining protein MreC
MLLDWLIRNKNIVTPTALFVASLFLLSINSYQRRDVKMSFFSRVVISVIGVGQQGVSGASGGLKDFWESYFALRQVEQQNQELKREVERLRRENNFLREQAKENERFRRLLNFQPREYIDSWIPAQVIGGPLSQYNKSITIDKGDRDGIKAQMAVITYDNWLVGQILDKPGSSIGFHTSQVLLITDRRSRVPVLVQRSRDNGIMTGRPVQGDCQLMYMMRNDDFRIGDEIVTSGLGGVFIKGWPVGVVVETNLDPELLSPGITIKPHADFSKLEEVLVIIPSEVEP